MRSHNLASFGLGILLLLSSCSDNDDEAGEHNEKAEAGEEESGTEYDKLADYDEIRRGARLRLAYDPDQDAFVGTIENTTNETLDQARIEVHLSNDVELGPTTPEDIPPGATVDVILPADGQDFATWSAHPEVGRDEHTTNGGEEEHDEGGESGEHESGGG